MITENDNTFDNLDINYLLHKGNIYTLKNKTTGDVFKDVKFQIMSTQIFFKPPSPGNGDYILQGDGGNEALWIGRSNVDDWLIKYEGRDGNYY